MKILIIANARYKDGLSGSDNIYLHFAENWKEVEVWDKMGVEFKPFTICYINRVLIGCCQAIFCGRRYDFIYSASDFWPDSLPAFILKLKGNKWVAGFYLYAPKENKIYYWSQKLTRWLINKYADVVCVTNGSLSWGFKGKKIIEVNGGVDLSLAGDDNKPKMYDAVFCGRLHYTKGIDELIAIWDLVIKEKPDAKLAIIGAGDTEEVKLFNWMKGKESVIYLGYMGNERFDVYRQSKFVLYPTPVKYDHFSMAPVEVMACGCPMIAFDLPVMEYIKPKGWYCAKSIEDFAHFITSFKYYDIMRRDAIRWAQTWDWKITTARVYGEITKCLKY